MVKLKLYYYINKTIINSTKQHQNVCMIYLLYYTVVLLSSNIMTSSNGNIFRVTGPLCGEFTGHRWLPLTKASDSELWCLLWYAPWINGWINNREAGDFKRHRAHYDVIVIQNLDKLWFSGLCMEPMKASLRNEYNELGANVSRSTLSLMQHYTVKYNDIHTCKHLSVYFAMNVAHLYI